MKEDSDSCFPRGRIPRSEEKNEAKKKLQVDKPENLFREAPKVLTEKKFEKKHKSEIEKAGWKKEERIEVEEEDLLKVKNVEFLQFKKLHEGMLILGCIRSIDELEMVVSLPNCLVGYIKVNRVSQQYTNLLKNKLQNQHQDNEFDEDFKLERLFDVGQLVVCSVCNFIPKKKSIQLTIDPEAVNSNLVFSTLKPGMMISGSIKSVEDHGFSIDVGRKGIKAFMATSAADRSSKLKLGSVIRMTIISSKANGNILTLSNNPQKLNRMVAKKEHGITLDTMYPGTLVTFTPTKTYDDGLIGNFLEFQGSVTALTNLPLGGAVHPADTPPATDDAPPKKKKKRREEPPSGSNKCDGSVIACVLCVMSSKHVVMTTNPRVWRNDLRKESIANNLDKYGIGERCKVKVVKVIKGMCFLCQVEKNGPYGVIYMRNLSDNQVDNDITNVLEHKLLKVRIVKNLNLDSMLEFTMKPSIMDADFIRFEDVTPGSLVQAKILSLHPKGLQVTVGTGQGKSFKPTGKIRGYVSSMHFSDVRLRHPEKKFNEGDVITCRVLTVDLVRRQLHLTHKASLVNSKIPPITGYNQLSDGDIVQVFIIAVKPVGCVVKMFNDVTGLVPRHQLSNDVIEDPEKDFTVGQVMKCRVLKSEPEQERLLLSFCLKPKQQELAAQSRDKVTSAGKIVDVRIESRTDNGFRVEILDQSEKRTAELPTVHLSDFMTLSNDAASSLDEGTLLKDCVITSAKTTPSVSMKPSLVSFTKQRQGENDLQLTFGDLQPDLMLPGFVRHLAEFGAFVEFPSGLIGLCPKSALCDRYIPTMDGQLEVGQSVVAMVTNVDQEKRRFLVSLRPSQCKLPDQPSTIIEMYMNQMQMWKDIVQDDVGLKIGEVVHLVDGRVQDLDKKYQFVVLNKPGEEGESPKAVVTHIEMSTNKIYLTQVGEVVKRYTRNKVKVTHDRVHCYVLYVNDDVAVGYSKSDGSLVYFATRGHCNQSNDVTQRLFKVNQVVQVSVKQCSDTGIILGETKPGKKIRQDSESSESSCGDVIQNIPNLQPGAEVEGRVKSIRATCALLLITSLPHVNGRPLVGRLHASEVTEQPQDDVIPLSCIRVGQLIKCYVIGCRDVRTHEFLEITHRKATRGVPELSLVRSKPTAHPSSTSLVERFPPGSHVTAYVKHFDKVHQCLRVELEPGVTGLIPRLLASKQPLTARKASKLRPGKSLFCSVVRNHGHHVILSRRGALIDSRTKCDVTKLVDGCITNGEVRKVVPDGLLVHIEPRSQGKIFLTDISDHFKENLLDGYKPGDVIRCAVLSCASSDQLVLSSRSSIVDPDVSGDVVDPDVTIEDLKPKKIVRGFIKSFSKAGIFVTLSRTCHGRVTFSYATKYFIAKHDDVTEYYAVGKLVTCSVVSVSPQDGRVELSMLEGETNLPDPIPESLNLPLKGAKRKKRPTESPDDVTALKKKKKIKPIVESKSSVEEIISKSSKNLEKVKIQTSEGKSLSASNVTDPGFIWDDDVTVANDDSDSGIDDIIKPDKKLKIEEESEIKRKEEELLCDVRIPESAGEWERVMVSNPNNSMLWVQFMAFHLHSTEVDKARAVAEKALKTISFREESEKLKVWVSLLNLENLFGSEEDLERTLGRAMEQTDQLKLFTHLTEIFIKSGKFEKAEQTFEKMTKKFRRHKEVWTCYVTFLMQQGRHEVAQEVFKKSLQVLEKKLHLDMISMFGRMEYVIGDAERGRSLFENSLTNFPKRTDIWSMYLDILIKTKHTDDARRVLEKVISLNISSKKMKSFFKRYIDFETKFGTESSVAEVRQKALEYLNSETSKIMVD